MGTVSAVVEYVAGLGRVNTRGSWKTKNAAVDRSHFDHPTARRDGIQRVGRTGSALDRLFDKIARNPTNTIRGGTM